MIKIIMLHIYSTVKLRAIRYYMIKLIMLRIHLRHSSKE